jgi:hypothetical protein
VESGGKASLGQRLPNSCLSTVVSTPRESALAASDRSTGCPSTPRSNAGDTGPAASSTGLSPDQVYAPSCRPIVMPFPSSKCVTAFEDQTMPVGPQITPAPGGSSGGTLIRACSTGSLRPLVASDLVQPTLRLNSSPSWRSTPPNFSTPLAWT